MVNYNAKHIVSRELITATITNLSGNLHVTKKLCQSLDLQSFVQLFGDSKATTPRILDWILDIFVSNATTPFALDFFVIAVSPGAAWTPGQSTKTSLEDVLEDQIDSGDYKVLQVEQSSLTHFDVEWRVRHKMNLSELVKRIQSKWASGALVGATPKFYLGCIVNQSDNGTNTSMYLFDRFTISNQPPTLM